MSDYSRQYDFSVKDALPVGDANKKIKGSEVDDEFDAIVTSNNTKANKVVTPTDGAYLVQDSNGDLADGGVVISSFTLIGRQSDRFGRQKASEFVGA